MAYVVLLLGLLPTTLSQDSLYITTEPSFWSSNNDNCTLATPSVGAFDNASYHLYDSLGMDLPLNESLWVGYYQVVRVLEYIGCVSIENLFIKEKANFVEIKGNPGHCFPGCGDNIIIGVTRTRCYCLDSDLNITDYTESSCDTICYHPLVNCGGKDYFGKKYLSIYKINLKVNAVSTIADHLEEKNCLALDPETPEKFIWESCEDRLSIMCVDGNHVHEIKHHEGQWGKVASMCFLLDMLPTVFSDLNNIDIYNGSKLWTGLFKTNVVYKHTSKIPVEPNRDKKLFGYLTRDFEDNVKLQFIEIDSSQRKLCYQDTVFDNQITSETTYSYAGFPITNDYSEEKQSPAIGVLTGICVSLVVVLLVAVSLACLYKRRLDHNRHKNYITPVYSMEVRGNNTTIQYNDHLEHYDDGELISHYYHYITPTEIINQENLALNLEMDGTNRTRGNNQSLGEERRSVEILETAAQTIPKEYELCENRTVMSNYEKLP